MFRQLIVLYDNSRVANCARFLNADGSPTKRDALAFLEWLQALIWADGIVVADYETEFAVSGYRHDSWSTMQAFSDLQDLSSNLPFQAEPLRVGPQSSVAAGLESLGQAEEMSREFEKFSECIEDAAYRVSDNFGGHAPFSWEKGDRDLAEAPDAHVTVRDERLLQSILQPEQSVEARKLRIVDLWRGSDGVADCVLLAGTSELRAKLRDHITSISDRDEQLALSAAIGATFRMEANASYAKVAPGLAVYEPAPSRALLAAGIRQRVFTALLAELRGSIPDVVGWPKDVDVLPTEPDVPFDAAQSVLNAARRCSGRPKIEDIVTEALKERSRRSGLRKELREIVERRREVVYCSAQRFSVQASRLKDSVGVFAETVAATSEGNRGSGYKRIEPLVVGTATAGVVIATAGLFGGVGLAAGLAPFIAATAAKATDILQERRRSSIAETLNRQLSSWAAIQCPQSDAARLVWASLGVRNTDELIVAAR